MELLERDHGTISIRPQDVVKTRAGNQDFDPVRVNRTGWDRIINEFLRSWCVMDFSDLIDEGIVPPGPAVLVAAIHFADAHSRTGKAKAPSRVVISGSGGVSFEWYESKQLVLEIEIDRDLNGIKRAFRDGRLVT